MKKQIMKKAWQIAKDGQKIYGGSVKSYFSEALKIAWSEHRKAAIPSLEWRVEHTEHDTPVKIWKKHNRCRVYVNRNGYEQAGYITEDGSDVRGRNSAEYKGLYYQATRPGNCSIIEHYIDALAA